MTKSNQGWTRIPPKRLQYDVACVHQASVEQGADLWHGYQYLDKFDIVAYRLGAHRYMAIQLPQGEDFERCNADLPTLRVTPIDPAVVWLRRNDATAELLRLWREGTDDWGLALLRAVYLAEPLLYLLTSEEGFYEVAEDYLSCQLVATKEKDDWTAGVFDGDLMLWRGHDNEHLIAAEAIEAARSWVDAIL